MRAGIAAAAALMAGVLAVAPAAAQGRPAPPPGRGGLTLNGSVFGGWDAPLFATDALATLQPTGQSFGGADGTLIYTRTGRSVTLGLTANANTSYYPKFTPKTQPAYGVGATLTSAGQGKWAWDLTGFARYAPIANTGLFAGANAANAQNFTFASGNAFQVSTVRQVDAYTTASLTYSPTRRTHVQAIGSVGTLIPIDGDIADNMRLNGRLRLARDLSRNFRGFVGYSVTQNRVADFRGTPGSTYTIDGVDFGIDFTRPFQITRNTSLSVATGLVNVPDAGSKNLQLTGSVSLDHRMGRTWNANIAASRDARFVQSFKDPVVFGGVSASLGGMFTTSLGGSLSGNYSKGTINGPTAGSSFETYSASARLRYDLLRLVATFIEYSVFRSDIEASPDLVGYPTGAFGRYSIRAGLSFGLNPFRTLARP